MSLVICKIIHIILYIKRVRETHTEYTYIWNLIWARIFKERRVMKG